MNGIEKEDIKNPLEIIESKQRLKEMELSGQYVFHGSPHLISKFEPRQAYTALDGESFADEEPAIFASSEIELPIFRSIFHPSNYENVKGSFSTGMSHGRDMEPFFQVSKDAMEASRGEKGYVYVFEKNDFELRDNIEWRSKKVIRPRAVFHSSFKDIGLPIRVDD